MNASFDKMTSFTYPIYIQATPERSGRDSPTPPSRNATGGTNGLVRRPFIRTGRRVPPTTWRTRKSGLL